MLSEECRNHLGFSALSSVGEYVLLLADEFAGTHRHQDDQSPVLIYGRRNDVFLACLSGDNNLLLQDPMQRRQPVPQQSCPLELQISGGLFHLTC